jgi:hypothetical protein
MSDVMQKQNDEIQSLKIRVTKLEDMLIVKYPKVIEGDFKSIVIDLLTKFLFNHEITQDKTTIPFGEVFLDPILPYYIFMPKFFILYVQQSPVKLPFNKRGISNILFSLGVVPKVYHIHKGQKQRVWCIPEKLINTPTEGDKVS